MEPGRRRTLIAALTIAGLSVPATHGTAGATGAQEDVLTAVAVASPTRDTTPDVQVTVTGDDAAALEYRVGGEPTWTAVAGFANTPGSHETVTFTPTLPPDATSSVEVRALDADAAVLDLDTVDVAVDVTVVAVLGGASGLTDDPTPTVTVDAEPGAVATWTLDGVSQGNAGLDLAGDATVTMPVLTDGPHAAVFSVQDAVGNTAERTVTFDVDTTAPVAPTPGAPVLVGRTVTVPVTWAEPGGSRQMRRSADGGTTWTAWSAWGGSTAGLTNAAWRLEFRQVDAAGNVGPAATAGVTVAVDDVAPPLEVGAPAGPVTIAAVAVAVDSEPGASVRVRVDGGAWAGVALDGGGRGWFTLSGLPNGTHRVDVEALDSAGNRAALDFTVLVAVPPAAPTPLPRAGLVSPSGPVTVDAGVVRRLPITLPSSLPAPVTAASVTASGGGAWVADAAGRVYTSGDAADRGDLARLGIVPNRAINGMAPTVTGQGYWLVAADGGIFAFGDAPFLGSMGGRRLNRPITAMAPTPSGRGYWLVAADGGIFAFGDAPFLGSTGAIVLNRPINGMAATPTGNGYWLFADDGGVFAFGDARFFGSLPGVPRFGGATAVGMIPTPTNLGYWIVTDDDRVWPFGDAR